MARVNPDVERLTREIDFLRKVDAERRKDPGDFPCTGCGDHSCEVHAPTGMGTNGGCRCDPREVRRALRWWKRRAVFLEETIVELRGQLAEKVTG